MSLKEANQKEEFFLEKNREEWRESTMFINIADWNMPNNNNKDVMLACNQQKIRFAWIKNVISNE